MSETLSGVLGNSRGNYVIFLIMVSFAASDAGPRF